jgi:hypothetical protein
VAQVVRGIGKEERMEQEPNTYYPGDVVGLTLEIEHLPNLPDQAGDERST